MNKVWLLLVCTDYEGSTVVGAFSSLEKCATTKAAWEAYGLRRPDPDLYDATDDGADQYYAAYEEWRVHHPAGNDDAALLLGGDGYAVLEMEVQ